MDCRPPHARKSKGEAMNRNVWFVHWTLPAVFALAATAVFSQQNNVSQGQNQRDNDQPETVQAKTEAAQGQTEDAQAQTKEDGKLISVPGGKALGMSILG